jgi:hypothetical protein
MKFIGNVPVKIEKLKGYDEFGQPKIFSSKKSRCSVVKLINKIEKTSVRTDSSASRSNAMEETGTSKLLLQLNSGVGLGDKLVVMGIDLKVDWIHYRNDTSGKPHHLEIAASIWV